MQAFLHWLTSLPLPLLYLVLGLAAAAENFFPPLPADTVVAVGSLLAARGNGSIVWVVVCTWVGNISGALVMYGLGRRFGAERLERRLLGERGPEAERRLRAAYGRYGLGAIFVSRFIPAIRAVVPPFAGALRVPVLRAALAIGLASGIWYGFVSWLGFRLGANWDVLSNTLRRESLTAAIVAAVLLAAVLGIWWWHHRKGAHGQ